MASISSKAFSPKKTKLFWCYWIVSAILLVLGIFFMPIWGGTDVPWKDWGKYFVYLCIAIVILLYLFGYLVGKIKRGGNGTVKVLTVVEFILLGLIALACIFLAIPQIHASVPAITTDSCRILGLAFWLRGVVEIFRAYYNREKSHFPVWWLCVVILLVTLGVWMFVQPFFSNTIVLWIFVIIILLLAIVFFIDGFLAKPAKRGK